MIIIVYVEGPSDQLAMQELLAGLLTRLEEKGIVIKFIPAGNKKNLLLKTPVKAINFLLNHPRSVVIALPDLYPPNQGFTHITSDELIHGLQAEFRRKLMHRQIDDERLHPRFLVFCFKYNLSQLEDSLMKSA